MPCSVRRPANEQPGLLDQAATAVLSAARGTTSVTTAKTATRRSLSMSAKCSPPRDSSSIGMQARIAPYRTHEFKDTGLLSVNPIPTIGTACTQLDRLLGPDPSEPFSQFFL